MIAGSKPPSAQSFRVKLEERLVPQTKTAPKTPKKVIKKKKKKAKKVVKSNQKVQETQKKQKVSKSQTKPFESAISSYVNPYYPRLALRRNITGVVRLTLWIKGDGSIDKIILAQSSGHSSLDASALDAAKQWTFKQLSANNDDLYKVSKTIVYKIN